MCVCQENEDDQGTDVTRKRERQGDREYEEQEDEERLMVEDIQNKEQQEVRKTD